MDGSNFLMDFEATNFEHHCQCSGADCDSPTANACGIHLHEGTSCADDDEAEIGGHYFDRTTITTDPWTCANGACYGPTIDEAKNEVGDTGIAFYGILTFTADFGYTLAESEGHVLVVHDATGARIGCAVMLEVDDDNDGSDDDNNNGGSDGGSDDDDDDWLDFCFDVHDGTED
jgi:hypothetical protein